MKSGVFYNPTAARAPAQHEWQPGKSVKSRTDLIKQIWFVDSSSRYHRGALGLAKLARYPNSGHALDSDMTLAPSAPSLLDLEAARVATRRTPDFSRGKLSAPTGDGT